MRKTYSLTSLSLLVLISLFLSCKNTPGPSVTERVAKVWTASQVDENSVTVYRRGTTGNVRPAYTVWKLDLSAPPSVVYVEWDGTQFKGQYSVTNDNTLTLTGLTPPPAGSTPPGTVTFTINSIGDSNLKLTNNATSQKTGGTTNAYTLTNP